jgi:hypothetical protein
MKQYPFSQTGGVRIGEGLDAFYATWPFAALYASENELLLAYPCRIDRFPKSSIRRLRREPSVLLDILGT